MPTKDDDDDDDGGFAYFEDIDNGTISIIPSSVLSSSSLHRRCFPQTADPPLSLCTANP